MAFELESNGNAFRCGTADMAVSFLRYPTAMGRSYNVFEGAVSKEELHDLEQKLRDAQLNIQNHRRKTQLRIGKVLIHVSR